MCRSLIVQAYGAFQNDAIFGDSDSIYCKTKVFNTEDFGFYKIVVERPMLDEDGKPVIKKGKPVADPDLRETENVPMSDDIEEYFQREVLPYAPDAWIDAKKTKVGYEIPMIRYFYEFKEPEKTEAILSRISNLEKSISTSLQSLLHEEVFS